MFKIRYIAALLVFAGMSTHANATEAVKITSHKHDGMDIVAGDSDTSRAYNQKGGDKPNAVWEFIPVPGDRNYVYICDWKHEECLVAGDTYDGNIYHQKHNNRDNAKWLRETSELAMKDGFRSHFTFTDKKHGKQLIAGDGYDGNLYHQDHNNRKNAIWKISNIGEFGYLRSYQYTNNPALGVAKTKSKLDTLTIWNPQKMLHKDSIFQFMHDGLLGCLTDQGAGGPAVFGVTPAGYWMAPEERKRIQNQQGITWGSCTGANNQNFILTDWSKNGTRNSLKSKSGNYVKLQFLQNSYPQNVVISHPSKPEQKPSVSGHSTVEGATGFWWDPNFVPK